MAVKTINGVAVASVKTVKGVAIASVKTVNGVDVSSYDSNAQAFFTATGITDTTIKNAVNALCLDLKGYSLFSKCYAIWPFVGGTSTTHSYNLVDTSLYQLTFSGGWTHASTGALPNGTTGYADTNLNPYTVISSQSDYALGMYSRTQTDSPATSWDIGAGDTSNGDGLIGLFTGRSGYQAAFDSPVQTNTYARVQYNGTRSDKMFIGTVRATNDRELYRDGSSVATLTTSYTNDAFQNGNLWLGCCNPTPAGLYYYAAHEFALAFVSTGLTDTEAANFTTAVNTFQSSLSRNV